MHRYEREAWIDAPFHDVWAFHANTDGLEALTPPWMQLRIESVTGPDGGVDPDVLTPGSRVRASTRPFGIGPRQGWISEIVERERTDGSAYFRDVMHDGPFDDWLHTHLFYAGEGEHTLVRDVVAYRLPLGPVDPYVGPVGAIGLDLLFKYRHARLAALLE